MMTAKEMMLDRLQRLPPDVSLREIREEVEVMIAVQRSLDDVRNGREHSHEEVVEIVKSWTAKNAGQLVP